MQREVDPVIGYPALREVVGADPLAPLSRAHLAPAISGDGRRLLLLRALEEARLEHAHGFRSVLDLRAFVLAGDHEAGGDVGDAHRGVGGVDSLPARARGAIDVDADVPLLDLDVHVLRLGEHGHRDGGSVDPAARLRGWHALHAMHPALELEPAPSAAALYEENDLLEAAHTGRMAVHDLHPPLLRLSVLRVHARKVGGEEARLVAPRPRPNLDEDVLVVVGIPGNEEGTQLLLELGLAGGELGYFRLRQLAHLAVGVLG